MQRLIRLLGRIELTQRLLILVVFGMMASALAISLKTEEVIEEALLEQTKKRAQIFLRGIEREIVRVGSPLDKKLVKSVLDSARQDGGQVLGFSVLRMYVYDTSGAIVAYSGEERPAARDMSKKYGRILHEDRPYESPAPEYEDGKLPKVDVIIPLHWQGRAVAGLEVEMDLQATMARIRAIDDRYEESILTILVATVVLLAIFIIYGVHVGLIKPINHLSQLTQRIASGDFSARSRGFAGEDAISRLGRAIDSMAGSLERLFNEQEASYIQVLQSLAKALEAKDSYTARHSARVAKYSVLLGHRLGLSEKQLKLLKQGALMHDLGKIGISDLILNKPERLDDREFEVMRSHPVMTAAIMRPLKRFKEFADIAAWHHERWDGNGYPDGLKGEEIPLLARIVAIADTWDAMTGDRIYRKGMSVDKALSILEAERDSGQWDPNLIGIFIDMIRGSEEAHHSVEEDMFAPEGAGTL